MNRRSPCGPLATLVLLASAQIGLPALAVSPLATAEHDPEVLLLFERHGDIWALTASRTERLLIRNASHPAFSRDGVRIAFVRGNWICVASAKRPSLVHRICRIPGIVESPIGTTVTWDPSNRYLVFAAFDSYRLTPAHLRKQTSGRTLYLGSLWTVCCAGGERIPVQWTVPELKGWDRVGAMGASAPMWSPTGSDVWFILGGSVARAHITGRDESGQALSGGPELDYRWECDVPIPCIPDVGGTSAPESVGYSRVSVSKDGGVLAVEAMRWNGGGDRRVEIWIRGTGNSAAYVRTNDLVGRHPSALASGTQVLYENEQDQTVCLRDLRTSRTSVVVKNAVDPEPNPTVDRMP